LLFKSANDDDSTVPHNPINRGNRWWCCFQRWHTKRNEGTIVVLLVFSTIADWTVSYWTGDGRRVAKMNGSRVRFASPQGNSRGWGKLWEKMKDAFSVRICRYVFCAYSARSRVVCIAPPCAELCYQYSARVQSIEIPVTCLCHFDTIQDNFSREPPSYRPLPIRTEVDIGGTMRNCCAYSDRRRLSSFPWLSDDGCWLWTVNLLRPSVEESQNRWPRLSSNSSASESGQKKKDYVRPHTSAASPFGPTAVHSSAKIFIDELLARTLLLLGQDCA